MEELEDFLGGEGVGGSRVKLGPLGVKILFRPLLGGAQNQLSDFYGGRL